MNQRVIKRYSKAFKRHVVAQVEQGRLSIAQAKRRFDIGGSDTIYRWLNAFGTTQHTCKVMRIQTPDEVDQVKDLQRQKQELESALAQAHLKILALESTLKVAQEHYGVDLKKNFATRASTTPERP